ncbi:hypothetical protein QMK19_37895 [Streptomyces sp. H10-C2]|uniref:hypothetical protein n=1 Tax=unclassified Streptomyces TaxID=2593676 RepID=UPI0024BA701C|nr:MULTISPECIES: hypothetical protein [unclassified Streptomyces]MDJ0340462.1 hypothetical protein [Streptomyces sp. PH10-H1]MDJ0375224.1 hypothetical protein [Streptomyces sp. H10-C2]
MAATAAVVLILEAMGIAFINMVLGLAVRHQNMSLAGLDPNAMAIGTWVGGVLFALFLIGCALVPARIALRGRPPGRFGRILIIVCAVGHGILGAVVVGLVGWPAFVLMMAVLALLVGTLLLYGDNNPVDNPVDADGGGGGGGGGESAAEVRGNEASPPGATAAA